MENTADQTLSDVLAFLVTLAAVALALRWLLRRLGRSRPDLNIGTAIGSALILRVLMAAAVSLTPYGSTLRGGDESAFLYFANQLQSKPLDSSAWTDSLTHELHIFILALQDKVLGSPELAMRTIEAGIAVTGIMLLAAAVHELAGARAALIASWLLALEPTGLFFSTLLHKESLMLLASGLVAFGGARLWGTAQLRALIPMAAGCLIAAATRGYASWFLIAALAAIALHAGIRAGQQGSPQSPVLVVSVVLMALIAGPIVIRASSAQSLQSLQYSQSANAMDQSNLRLEAVDFSTGGAVVRNLPLRIRDVLLKPFPWQLGNISQQFGLLGTTVAYVTLLFLAWCLFSSRGSIMQRAGPFIYIGFFLLIAYSLSAGNAGTAFRYRMHIVAIGLCAVVAIRFAQSPATQEGGRLSLHATPQLSGRRA